MCCNANDLFLLVGSFDYKICFIYSVSFLPTFCFVIMFLFSHFQRLKCNWTNKYNHKCSFVIFCWECFAGKDCLKSVTHGHQQRLCFFFVKLF